MALSTAVARAVVLCLLGVLSGADSLFISAISEAHAASAHPFAMSLDLRHVEQAEVDTLKSFVTEAERALPPRVKLTIGSRVAVSFSSLDDRIEIAPPPCTEAASSRAAQALAEVSISDRQDVPHRVLLHAGLKSIIMKGRGAAQSYSCGHRSLYKLALATLIHELFHIYDARSALSRDPRFVHLGRFAPQGIFRRIAARNELAERSPDPYEFHSIHESLAVNAEFFLLDPEFRCRRPAMYAFLEGALGYRPFPQAPCEMSATVYRDGQPLRIDLDRVYEVHYLLASAGSGIGSRFGHAMFRLVICAEDRATVGPECREDIQDHLVLGFAANLQGDRGVSAWKGLSGGYLSQLFVKSLSEVIIEYTEREFRELDSIPLRMTDAEKRMFIYRALEIYWGYRGRYFFLTNNCAVESLSLLKSVLASPRLQSIERITPSGLRADLERLELASSHAALDRQPAEQLGLHFPSLFAKYDATFSELVPRLPQEAPRKLKQYLDDTQALGRRRWVAAIQGPGSLPIVARAFAIEGLIENRIRREAERLIIRFVQRSADSPQKRALVSKLDSLLQLLGNDVPWRRVKSGYGVPLPQEIIDVPHVARDQLRRQLIDEAFRILRDKFPKQYAEWRHTQENRSLILNRLSTESAPLRAVRSQIEKDLHALH